MSLGANHGVLGTVLGKASVPPGGTIYAYLSDEVASSEIERAVERSELSA